MSRSTRDDVLVLHLELSNDVDIKSAIFREELEQTLNQILAQFIRDERATKQKRKRVEHKRISKRSENSEEAFKIRVKIHDVERDTSADGIIGKFGAAVNIDDVDNFDEVMRRRTEQKIRIKVYLSMDNMEHAELLPLIVEKINRYGVRQLSEQLHYKVNK